MKERMGFGIDFGTTNSVAAMFNPRIGKTSKLAGPEPSVVWYKAGGKTVVGSHAKNNLIGFANVPGNRFVTSVKRQLGKKDDLTIFGESVPVSSIAAEVFKHIIDEARGSEHGLDLKECVLTIPVHFNGESRRALRRAADEAGIFVRRFVHEPFAAIVGYWYSESKGRDVSDYDGKLTLVFDWGGGTLDVTLAKIHDGMFEELANGGMPDKAGDHFDEKLKSFALRRFVKELNVLENEIDPAPQDLDRLRAECERAKIKLSTHHRDLIQVSRFCLYKRVSQNLRCEVTRNEFSDLIQDDVVESMKIVTDVLEEAQVHPDEIDRVLLIGGSSRIPLLRDEMIKRFSHRLVQVENADTIIAEGAAIVDALGMQPTLARDIDVILSDGTPLTIFKKGTYAIPEQCDQNLRFYCTDNREGRAFIVVGERRGRVGQVHKIKTIVPIPISLDLPIPFNAERVETNFRIDEDIVLHVAGKGATKDYGNRCEVYDLCFGLSIPEEKDDI